MGRGGADDLPSVVRAEGATVRLDSGLHRNDGSAERAADSPSVVGAEGATVRLDSGLRRNDEWAEAEPMISLPSSGRKVPRSVWIPAYTGMTDRRSVPLIPLPSSGRKVPRSVWIPAYAGMTNGPRRSR